MSKLATKEDINLLFIQYPNAFLEKIRQIGVEINDETRQAFCDMGPKMAYVYARDLEEKPHDLTRKVASEDASLAWQYAWWVDCCPHPVTRAGVQSVEYLRNAYSRYSEKGKVVKW